jgi:hypothetical protein
VIARFGKCRKGVWNVLSPQNYVKILGLAIAPGVARVRECAADQKRRACRFEQPKRMNIEGEQPISSHRDAAGVH